MVEGSIPVGVYRFREKLADASAADQTFIGPAVHRGNILELELGYVADYTTANKQLLIGFRDAGGSDHFIATVKETSTLSLGLQGKLILLSGERPIAKVLSATLHDVLYCTFSGLLYGQI
jgi:hypothetical protein